MMRKSMKPVPDAEIVIDAETFAERPEYPPYDKVELMLCAEVPPVFAKETRMMKLIPPT